MNTSTGSLTKLKNKIGDSVEIRSHIGSRGTMIDIITTKTDGKIIKEFSPRTRFPIPDDKVQSSLLREISRYLTKEFEVVSSTLSLSFPMQDELLEIPFLEFTSIYEDKDMLHRLIDDNSYTAMAIPLHAKRVIVLVGLLMDEDYSYNMVSMHSTDQQVTPIPIPLLSKLCNWAFTLQKPMLLEGYVTRNNNLVVANVLGVYNERWDFSTVTTGVDKLTSLLGEMPDCISLATIKKSKENKKELVDLCTQNGTELLFISDTKSVNNFSVHFKQTTVLQVMSLNLSKGTVSLCAGISGVPVEIAESYLNTSLNLQPMDNVLVEYGGVRCGRLEYTSIKETVGCNEYVALDPFIANRMGFNLKPQEICKPSLHSRNTGILAALDASHIKPKS